MSTEQRNPLVESIAAAIHARHCPCDVWPCVWRADPNDPSDIPAADLVEGWRTDAEAALTAALDGIPEPLPDGEIARQWVGSHYQQIKGAMADALNGASVNGTKITGERAQQLATLCMAAMAHAYPDDPWQGDLNEALHTFAESQEQIP